MPLPGGLTTITVTGSYPNIAGQPQNGTVVFDPGQPIANSAGQVILTGAVTVNVFNSVMQPVVLPCTDNSGLNPTGFTFTVTATINGVKQAAYSVSLPSTLGSTVDLSSLVPASSSPGVSTVYGVLATANTWSGANTFDGETIVQTPVNSGDAATKAYVDANAGAVSSVNTQTGAVVLTAAEVGADVSGSAATETARAEAAEALLAPLAGAAFTGAVTAPDFAPGGLTGVAHPSRYVGAVASSAAPSSGTFLLGDYVIDQTGAVWVCTVAGSPGTWVKIGALNASAGNIQPIGTANAAGSTGKSADAGHVHAGLSNVATTGNSGYTLVNGSATILSWTAPNDGALHRFTVFSMKDVTSTETGGQINVTFTLPDSSAGDFVIFAGAAAAGVRYPSAGQLICKANTTVSLNQTALAGGATTLWAEIWAS